MTLWFLFRRRSVLHLAAFVSLQVGCGASRVATAFERDAAETLWLQGRAVRPDGGGTVSQGAIGRTVLNPPFIEWRGARVLASFLAQTSPALSEVTCRSAEATLHRYRSVDIALGASCEPGDGRTRLTVRVRERGSERRLTAFVVGFCGIVLSAEAPRGWDVEVLAPVSTRSAAATVRWSHAADTPLPAAQSRFAVVLAPGWRAAPRAFAASWTGMSAAGGEGSGTFDVCAG